VSKGNLAKMVFLDLPALLVTLVVQAQLDLKANPVLLDTLAQLVPSVP
jgi:hypothetical protein